MKPIRRTRPIPADGLERALRDGRHRRRRAAAFACAPALSLVVALVLVLQGGGGGQDSLGTLNDPEGTSTASADPTASETPSPEDSAEPATDPEPSGDPSAEASTEPECVDDGCSNEDDSGSYGTPPPHGDPIPFTDSHQTLPSTANCAPYPGVPGSHGYTLCAYQSLEGSSTIRPGETTTLVTELCRGVDGQADDLVLRFPSGQEHDGLLFTQRDKAGVEVWRFGSTVMFTGGAHTATLMQQTCFSWRTTWDGTGNDRKRVAAGTYYFRGYRTEEDAPVPASGGLAVTVAD